MAVLRFILCMFALVSMQTVSAELNLGRVSQSFTQSLCAEIVKNKPHENIIISPLSIHVALGLLSMGATGETAEQIQAYLGSNSRSEIAGSFQGLLMRHENNSLVQLANKVYSMQGSTVNPKFNEIAKKQFFSEAAVVDFADSENAARSINSWVESKTDNKIQDLISASSLDSMTRLVLVNAIYFNGKWAHEFPIHNTRDRTFYYSESDFESIPMMMKETQLRHGVFESLDAAAVELPYKDSDLSMIIFLPNQRTGIDYLVEKLGTANLADLCAHMTLKKVHVTMPRFKIESGIELNDILKAMGITKIFEDAELGDLLVADLPLYVSKVVHKAFIDVSEEGTEAAGSTGIVIQGRSGRIDWPKYFTVDHPFSYIIKDSQGVVYFAGKYSRKSG